MRIIDIKKGLTKEEVIDSLAKYGNNTLLSPVQETFFKRLIHTLNDPIIRILLIALGIKTVFLLKNFDWFETVGIVIAILLASFVSSISEYGSELAFNKLQEESSKIKCRVQRFNSLKELNIDEIVKGDIVLLSQGDKIPADGVLIEGKLCVDESSLNGETKEVYKESIRDLSSYHDNNFLYRGSVIYSDEGKMLVTKVGKDTFYGKMASEISEKQPESPLKTRLRQLATVISRIGYLGAFLVAFSYLFSVIVIDNNFEMIKIMETLTNFQLMTGYILYTLTLSVTIIVVAVPEGLPMMITLVLSSNMKRMLKNNVLVRKLVGIETAGNLNILFTDKTGTLTKGKLEVTTIINGNNKSFYKIEDIELFPSFHKMVLKSLIANNSGTYDVKEKKVIGGNTTDQALLLFGKSKQSFEVVKSVPFDSNNKYSLAIVEDNNHFEYLIKGSPEKLIEYCNTYYDDNGQKLFFLKKDIIKKEIDLATKKGIRVLLLATSKNEIMTSNINNLTFVGLVLIKDEIREDAVSGIKMVNNAHIQTVMITGDNKNTACEIAKQVGLITKESDIVLTSTSLNKLTDDELKKMLPNLRVVARAFPQDKSRLIRISQELGLVVGMTGDGVNDAGALKRADVGFAMGSGTEVSKEASDIVILDDNFLSISKAILFGRTVFKSIRKFIIFQLTVNLCAVGLSIVGPFIGIDTPVTVIQMLWINMVMDTLAGIAFAYEPPLLEYMNEYPHRKEEAILNKYMLGEIIFTGLFSFILCLLFLKVPFFYHLFRLDPNNKYFLTAFFGLFIFIGIFNSFNARTHRINLLAHILKNKIFILVIIFIIVVQIIMIYYGGHLFRTAGLTAKEFIFMLMLAFLVVPADFVRKIILRGRHQKGGV